MAFIDKENGQAKNSLWCERYRPTSLDNFIGNEHLKQKLKGFIESGDIGHLLLWGSAGTGKTSTAKLLVNSIDCDFLFINASDENNVDTMRNKIKGFASTIGFSPIKIVVLDECLDENTLVTVLHDGKEVQVAIKDVDDKNDLVKSWNVKRNEIQYRPFYLWDKGDQDVYEVELENGEVVVCTPDHKWYVEDETGNTLVVKTTDLPKYQHILSPK